VAIFLEYCDEFESFVALTNLIHSHIHTHFFIMIRGYVSDTKLRIALFESLFKRNLPDLYEHF